MKDNNELSSEQNPILPHNNENAEIDVENASEDDFQLDLQAGDIVIYTEQIVNPIIHE